MAAETMTSEERVWAAIRLEKPDRVPINILATTAYAAVAGRTAADWLASTMNDDEGWAIIDKVWDYTGGWDMDLASIPPGGPRRTKLSLCASMGVKMRVPGVDLPADCTAQAVEEEVMTPRDYDTVAEIGWQRFVYEDYLFRIMDSPEGRRFSLWIVLPISSPPRRRCAVTCAWPATYRPH